MFAELKGVSRDSHIYIYIYIYILDFLQVRYNCAKSHHCRICVTDFREGVLYDPLPFSIREQPQKSPSCVGLKPYAC